MVTTEVPIKLGTILFTMVEPKRGREVEYNRWYERDHFYAGCMIGEFCFAGRRFVATRELKELRTVPDPSFVKDAETGSYLALYWILAGHDDAWNQWGVDQVNVLHKAGRMFADRDHIHTLLYTYQWAVRRDPDGVPPELALDHPYGGLVALVGETDGPAMESTWLKEEWVPSVVQASGADLGMVFTPIPLLGDAPGDVPRNQPSPGRFLSLFFLPNDPRGVWESSFATAGDTLAAAGGSLTWAGPFIPTIPGTDTYTDQLW
jgi:hypothetical protein